jgi:parallel beta-helix repeat protein
MPTKLPPRAATAAALAVALIGTFAVVALVASSGAAVAAKQPECGDTIKKDTTLHHDLVNCPNNGIVIGADNVTLDLNGHTIDGDGKRFTPCGKNEFCDIGVVNLGQSAGVGTGHDGVTVMHGSVHGFLAGVNIATASHNRVLGISASRNHFFGIGLVEVARSLVRNSSFFRNGLQTSEAGIALFDSHHTRILHNSVRHNGLAGITLAPGSRNLIAENHVAGGRDGIRIEKGRGNLVAHNVVIGARNGIRLGIRHPFLGGAHNVVRGNLVRDSRADGLLVNKKAHHSLLKRNVARGAGDDGLDVNNPTTKLTGNEARRNGDLGIEAVRGVIDGGGNKASGNRDPRQCTHIACS